MHLNNLFLMAAAATTAQATCYGFKVGDYGLKIKKTTDDQIWKICNETFSGFYLGGQSKYHCLDYGQTKNEFFIRWTGRGRRRGNFEECKFRLRNERDDCEYGGQSVYNDWLFR